MLETLTNPFNPYLKSLSAFIEKQAETFEPEIREAALYALQNRGKRLRPLLVFSSGWKASKQVSEPLVRLGTIVELIHLATLIHDDILDGACLRHNRPPLYQRYGTNVAVLLGDAFLSRSMELASEFDSMDICRTLTRTVSQICNGEIKQTLQSASGEAMTIDSYYRIIYLKTATLFETSCRLGAQIAHYPDSFVEAVAAFGRHLGTAYQLLDDLMDCVGDEQNAGKTLGTDLKNGKATLPFLILDQKLTSTGATGLATSSRQTGLEFETQFDQYGVFQDVEAYFDREIEAAEAALDTCETAPPLPYLRKMLSLIRSKMTETLRKPVYK